MRISDWSSDVCSSDLMGCGVRALDPAHQLGSEGLADGDVIAVDGLEVHVIGTPGHTSDSLSFHVPADGAVLTGDTVLGRSEERRVGKECVSPCRSRW